MAKKLTKDDLNNYRVKSGDLNIGVIHGVRFSDWYDITTGEFVFLTKKDMETFKEINEMDKPVRKY